MTNGMFTRLLNRMKHVLFLLDKRILRLEEKIRELLIVFHLGFTRYYLYKWLVRWSVSYLTLPVGSLWWHNPLLNDRSPTEIIDSPSVSFVSFKNPFPLLSVSAIGLFCLLLNHPLSTSDLARTYYGSVCVS